MPELAEREKDHAEKVLAAGKWITVEFLQDLLIKNEKSEKIKIIEKKVTPAVGLGNNYLSTLHRVAVKFCKNGTGPVERHLIIKEFPYAKLTHKFLNDLSVFEKEIYNYTRILPRLNEIFKEFSEEPFMAPISYSSPLENLLIMEDLKMEGYEMVERQHQLSFEHCEQALKSLARLHVLSLVFEKRYPGAMDDVTTDFYTEKSREHMEPFMSQIAPILGELCQEIPKLEKFSQVVTEFGTKGYDILIKVFERASKNFLQVFCHGDMWLTNMMFKHDEKGRVAHAKFVDFQLCRKSSPAIDVLHQLFTSPQPEVLTEKWEDLIKIYYNAFQENVKLFGLTEQYFTLEEFHRELKRLSPYAFHLIMIILPSVLVDPENVVDIEKIDADTFELPEGGAWVKETFAKEKPRNAITKFFKQFESLGYLEIIKKELEDS